MKDPVVGYKKEFEELIGSLSDSIQENDPLTIGLMLYSIAEERKDTNVVMREINAKLDSLAKKIEELDAQVATPGVQQTGLSERDQEVLEYVSTKERVCAQELQVKFKYRGKNAASARLSKLFHEGMLEKEYAGRRVYYKVR
jgi:predicted HTH transcriptional regulator